MALQLIATRVDDRLIHGQGLAWLANLPVNLVVVVDDEVSKSEFEQDLMLTLVPQYIDSRFFSVEKSIAVLNKAADRQKIFLLFKKIEDVLTCIKGGIPIKELNVGNLRRRKGTTKVTSYVNLLPNEFDTIEELKKLKIKLTSKQTPMGEAVGEHIDFKTILQLKPQIKKGE